MDRVLNHVHQELDAMIRARWSSLGDERAEGLLREVAGAISTLRRVKADLLLLVWEV